MSVWTLLKSWVLKQVLLVPKAISKITISTVKKTGKILKKKTKEEIEDKKTEEHHSSVDSRRMYDSIKWENIGEELSWVWLAIDEKEIKHDSKEVQYLDKQQENYVKNLEEQDNKEGKSKPNGVTVFIKNNYRYFILASAIWVSWYMIDSIIDWASKNFNEWKYIENCHPKIIEKWDTLYKISERTWDSVENLMKRNWINDGTKIHEGKTIEICTKYRI